MHTRLSMALLVVVCCLLPSCGGETASIERVLKEDAKTMDSATSIVQVVDRMRAIDLKGCPRDFTVAYVSHVHAWELMAMVESEAAAQRADNASGAALLESALRGFLGDPFGKANEMIASENKLQRDYREALQQVKLTYDRVENTAVAHGARLPKR